MSDPLHTKLRTIGVAVSLAAALSTSPGCGDESDGARNDEADGAADAALPDTEAADADSTENETTDSASADTEPPDSPTETDQADAAADPADPEAADTSDATTVNRGAPDIDLESVSGFRHDSLTYTVPGLEVERTLDIHVWYATDDTEGEAARFAIFLDNFALEGATVSPPSEGEPAPLLVYSHGGRGFSGQISTVARQFVRNGWIVVAPSHPGDNLFDTAEQLPVSFPAIRAFDVVQAISWVENLPDEHPLSGRVDTSRVLTMGHSYGGQNSWILNGLAFDLEGLRARCGEGFTAEDLEAFEAVNPDPRVVAGVSLDCTMDANLVPDEGFAAVDHPMLHMSGTEGNHAVEIFGRAAAAELTWVSLIGGCHESFTGTLHCPTLPLAESLAATATYTIAFGTRHVLGSSDPMVLGILDGSVAVSASAELMRTERAQ